MGKVALISSGKGGVGKTTVAINLGATLALKGARVVLVDFNMGLRNLDIYMGMEDRCLFDLGDVFTGVCRVERALARDERFGELYMLPCPQFKNIDGISADHIKGLFALLKNRFDYLLVDMPLNMGAVLECVAPAADIGIVVLVPDFVALRNADTMDRRLEALGIRKRCYIVNKVDRKLQASAAVPDMEKIDRNMRIPMAGIIPWDEKIHSGNNSGTPVVIAQNSYIAKNFSNIACRIF